MTTQEIITTYIPTGASPVEHGSTIVFEVSVDDIRSVCTRLFREQQLPLKTMYAVDARSDEQSFKIFYVFGILGEGRFVAPYIVLKNTTEFPSLVAEIHQTFLYERKIQSFFGLTPVGHPDPRRLILHDNWPENNYPLRKDVAWNVRPDTARVPYEFTRIDGEGVYELSVGPVHAGIIEPGHFRFSVAGEEIMRLEARLGYVHKGVEKLFETLPPERHVQLAERISGDTTFTHALAYVQAVEELAGVEVPVRARSLRVLYSEMERLANHFNDIGFIMLDTAYTFGGSNGARLREMIMQWIERLSGNRYFRGVNVVGGVTTDIPKELLQELVRHLQQIKKDFSEVMQIAYNSDILRDRIERSGKISRELAQDFGAVGIAARAVGIARDSRIDFPYAAYNDVDVHSVTRDTGDVDGRFRVRVGEVYESMAIIERIAEKLATQNGAIHTAVGALTPSSMAVGIAEGWRGDIVTVVMTDQRGAISRVSVRDPSFLNWPLVTAAVVGNIIPDFPLVNKSFNLSYSGNDL